jgi:hypothetical protein
MGAKSILGAVSRAWGALTDDERNAWATWAANNPVTDRMGAKQVLAGNAAYMMLNGRLLAAGLTAVDLPPIGYAPPGLDIVTITPDIGSVPMAVQHVPATLDTNDRIWVQAAVTEGESQMYVKSKLRFLGVSSAALAADLVAIAKPDLKAAILATALANKFGTLAAGQFLTLYLSVFDGVTGLLSTPRIVQALLVDTP